MSRPADPARVRAFPPILGPRPRILVLGSLPGVASLRAGQYYAHPRNQFWPIMGALVGAGPELDYALRLERLKAAGIALWDVLGACRRQGSLDQRIDRNSREPNPLRALCDRHPGLRHCLLNGSTAGSIFARLPAAMSPGLPHTVLPSTSPAHARLRLPDKLERWRAALLPLLRA